MKTFTDWDFARAGRTVHAWQDLPLQVGQMDVTVCGITAVKARARFIAADDRRCAKCIQLETERINQARAALQSANA